MQVEVPQIFWHYDSARIMSIDFYPNSNYLITASQASEDDTGLRVIIISQLRFIVLGVHSSQ